MASFRAKTGWKMLRMREYKNYRSVPFRSVPTRREIENFKKIAIKLKKLKNTIMDLSSQNRFEMAENERK